MKKYDDFVELLSVTDEETNADVACKDGKDEGDTCNRTLKRWADIS